MDFVLSTSKEKIVRERTDDELKQAAFVNEYPREIYITTLENLKDAAQYDHIAGIFEGNHRANEDIKFTKCIIMDCDNDGSENSADWLTPEKLAERLKGIEFLIIYSKSHMKEKDNFSARPRFHIYFPLKRFLKSDNEVKGAKEAILRLCPEFDPKAKDTARLIFGVPYPEGLHFKGENDILSVIESEDFSKQLDLSQVDFSPEVKLTTEENENLSTPVNDNVEKTKESVIPEGTRNSTMYEKALGYLFNYPYEQAIENFKQESMKCTPRLSNGELNKIWDSALKSDLMTLRLNASVCLEQYSNVAEARQEFYKLNAKYSEQLRASAFEAALKIAGMNGAFENEGNPLEKIEHEAVSYRLKNFFEVVKKNREGAAISTGFSNLDDVLDGGFYPGLYFLGANSSTGKTSMLLQIADNIAQAGHEVLYFSLEMSANELIAKSISRLSLIYDMEKNHSNNNAKSTRDILLGHYDENDILLSEAVKQYAEYGKNLYINEGVGDIGVNFIKAKTNDFINFTGRQPVVIIDYLQILAPYDKKLSDKQNVDVNTLELKRLSRDCDIPILGISSFNRENYKNPVSMASFKESGAIEYSSDVLIGMQYNGWDYKGDEKDSERTIRLRGISQAMSESANKGLPQEIQIKILKNRNGRRKDVLFEFSPKFNYFRSI